MDTLPERDPASRLVVIPTKLIVAVPPGQTVDGAGIHDTLNLMLIPHQLKEGGNSDLVDYAFENPLETGVKLANYDYDNGLPEAELDRRGLLVAAAAAKLRYWDALRAIELHYLGNGDVPDRVDHALEALMSTLAGGLDEAGQAEHMIEQEHVDMLDDVFADAGAGA